jgi:3-hydroxyisobutyrate dehydrogenase
MLWFGQAIATAEALLLARHAGIDLDVLRQALMDSAASSAFIRSNLGALLAGVSQAAAGWVTSQCGASRPGQ